MKMKNNELKEMRKWMFLIVFAILVFWLVNNFGIIWGIVNRVLGVLFPFILGAVIAFILNIPMVKIEKVLKKVVKKDKYKGLVRTISIVLSLLIFVVVVLLVAFLLIPELIENVESLINSIPSLINNLEVWVVDLLDKYPDVQVQIEDAFNNSDYNVGSIISNVLNYFINGAIGFISSLVSSCVTFFTAIVFSVYMLSQKEYLIKGMKKLLYAYIDKDRVDKFLEIGSLADSTFSKFISGQCVEAVILGCIIFVALKLFGFPYALIISVLTAVTALIPIFGAIIAMVIGAILIGITNPIKAILFIVVFQVVQQIEGNFIYPKVVGKSVGLSPMWTLLAITAGGSLFGIVGMLVGLPLASIVYALIRSNVNNRIKEKKIVL